MIEKQSTKTKKDFNHKNLTKQADGIDQESDCTFCAVWSWSMLSAKVPVFAYGAERDELLVDSLNLTWTKARGLKSIECQLL